MNAVMSFDLFSAILLPISVVVCMRGKHFQPVFHHFHVVEVVPQYFVGLALGQALMQAILPMALFLHYYIAN